MHIRALSRVVNIRIQIYVFCMEREEIPITTYQDFYYSQVVVRLMSKRAVFVCDDVSLETF